VIARRIRKTLLIGLLAAGLPMSGCMTAAFLDTAAHNIFQRKDVNLIAKNQAAADFLVQQFPTFVTNKDLIKALPLTESNENHGIVKIGRIIPEHVGVRLARLGYRMDMNDVLTSPDVNYMRPDIAAGEAPKFLLTGTYLRRRLDMDVNLRVMNAATGQIVAAFDYTLPMNPEIAELSAPQVEIYRTQQ
jgi:hypothetical protein